MWSVDFFHLILVKVLTCYDDITRFRHRVALFYVLITWCASACNDLAGESVDSVELTCLNVDEQQFVHAYVLIRYDNTRMIH